MKKSYEFFLDFPTTDDIIKYQNYSGDKNSYFKIDQIFKEWGEDRIFFTLSKSNYKKAIKDIDNKTERINILKNLCNEKDNKEEKNSSNSKNLNRECRLTIDLKNELLEILILHGKLTEFIDNNGDVKDNPEEFDKFCVDLLKGIFVDKFYIDESLEKYMEQNGAEDVEEERLGEDMEEKEGRKKKKNDDNLIVNKEHNNLLSSVNNDSCNKIKSFVIENIKNSEEIKQMFLLTYFIFNDYKINNNKEKSPSKMHKILDNKITARTSQEKENEIRRILDPLDFWIDFEKEFKEEIKNNDYYKVLYKLISKPKIEKKQDYVSEEITRKQYREMNRIEKKIFSFIDGCKEELNNKINIKQQLQKDLQILLNNMDENNKVLYENTKEYFNSVSKSSNEELINSLLAKIKPFFLGFIKNTRKDDIDLKKEALEKLENKNVNTCGNKIFNNENIFLYAQNLLVEQEKDVIKKHLENCNKCKAFYYAIKQGLNYRKKRDKQIFYLLKNPYSVVKKYKTETEYLNNLTVEYYNKEFKQNPCDANFYYLILSHINNGNIDFAEKLLDDGINVYKEDTAFIKRTIIDLKK